MTKQERIKAIEDIVTESSPIPNESALGTIRRHVAALRSEVSGIYAQGKLAEIEQYAGEYFSQRKHARYPGGAEQVAVWIIGACAAIANPSPFGD